jgi:isochorismate synthase EntC
MSSAAQTLANRQNAALSTGPATPEGKEASSKNATRHGLSGVFTPFPHENREEFDLIATGLRTEFKPEGENESFLVDQMIQARCRMLRVQRLEDQAYEQILTEPGSAAGPDARILAALTQSRNAIDKLQRYRATAERQYYKALRELQSSRVRTQKAEATALENYIAKVVYAPIPSEPERKSNQEKQQNEPNSPPQEKRPAADRGPRRSG